MWIYLLVLAIAFYLKYCNLFMSVEENCRRKGGGEYVLGFKKFSFGHLALLLKFDMSCFVPICNLNSM